jgi:hypothetical protein
MCGEEEMTKSTHTEKKQGEFWADAVVAGEWIFKFEF